jgi:hypothetical protein
MGEWRELAERLVELDLAIEDLSSWATAPEDVANLAQLESLRAEVLRAIAEERISPRLRQRLGHGEFRRSLTLVPDPRD